VRAATQRRRPYCFSAREIDHYGSVREMVEGDARRGA
jgi:hypothetical protein